MRALALLLCPPPALIATALLLHRSHSWERARKFGLDPPEAVRQMLTVPQGEGVNACLWEGRL